MASSIQIVPKWKHSYVETYVYDNTEITESQAPDVSDAVKTMHVFRSSRGIDNLLVRKTSTTKFAEEFGKTDYKKYGQPLMMPYASLTGGAVTSNMRMMPHDATYANSNLYMYYRITERTVMDIPETISMTNALRAAIAPQSDEVTWDDIDAAAGDAEDITTPTTPVVGEDGDNGETEGTPGENGDGETVESGNGEETGGETTGDGDGTENITPPSGGTIEPETPPVDVTPTEPSTPVITAKKIPVFQVMFRNTKMGPDLDKATNKIVEGGTVGLRSKNDISALSRSIVRPIAGREVPADGSPVPSWTGKYLGTVYTTGRGVYGNNYRWRAVKNTDYEKDYGRELYTWEVLTTEGGLHKVAAYVGSVQDCVVNDTSVRIDDVLSSYAVGTYPVAVTLDDNSIQDVYDAYVEFLEGLAADGLEVTIPSYEEFDPLFGKYIKTSEPYEYYQVVGVDDDAYPIVDDVDNCVIDNSTGVPLAGGYDGLFSTFKDPTTGENIYGPTMPITREIIQNEGMEDISGITEGVTTIESMLYVKAFNGLTDRKILSTIRVPADYVCDGNYPYEGKLAMAKLLDARWDCLGYYDLGLGIESFSQGVFNEIKNRYDGVFNTNAVSKNIQKFQVRDPFSKRWVWVTQTYKIAEQLPVHINTYGIQEAFAKSLARYTGIKADSVTPSIDLWENELMSTLAERRLNYIEASDEDVYQRGMQNTSQPITSDLLEESNMHVLFWLKRHIERDVFDNQYHFSDPAERATFRQVEKAKYENIIGTMVATLDIRFDMNEYETERQIIHCYVDVTFRTLQKQGIIEIDVNKRSYEATLAA